MNQNQNQKKKKIVSGPTKYKSQAPNPSSLLCDAKAFVHSQSEHVISLTLDNSALYIYIKTTAFQFNSIESCINQ